MKGGKRMDVMCVGIATCDVLLKVRTDNFLKEDTTIADAIVVSTGGDALNVSVNLSKMGISSAVCAKIGRDKYGRLIKETLEREGVDGKWLCEREDSSTSVSTVIISEGGKRNFIFFPGATSEFTYEDVNLKCLNEIKVLDIGSYFALPSFEGMKMQKLLSYAKELGIITVMDVTNNPQKKDLEKLESVLPYIDYFIPSFAEATALTGTNDIEESISVFRKLGARTVIVKLGEEGAVGNEGENCIYVPATPDFPVDTTGAGDCFVAGIIASILKGFSMKEAMVFACKAAGLSITQIGATTATTAFEEIYKRHSAYYEKGEIFNESNNNNL